MNKKIQKWLKADPPLSDAERLAGIVRHKLQRRSVCWVGGGAVTQNLTKCQRCNNAFWQEVDNG